MEKNNPNQNTQTMDSIIAQTREVTRQGVEQSYAVSKQLLDVWTTGIEATLKASFELQKSVINTGRSLMEPADSFNQALYKQWTDAVHTAQQATLDALDATKRLTKQFETK